jgi:transcriptional regulator with XRE-family HTH domain
MTARGKLQIAMAKSGLTRKTIAIRTGFTPVYIDMILSGKRSVSIHFLRKVLPVLREHSADPMLTIDDLVNEYDDNDND